MNRALSIIALSLPILLLLTTHCELCLAIESGISEKLDLVLENDSLDDEMIEYSDQLHAIQKSRLKSTLDSNVLIRLADIMARTAQLRFAIKSKFVDVFKNDILKRYEDNDEEDDLVKLRLILARAWLRCKLTVMMYTGSSWKRSFKLIERYQKDEPKMKDLLLATVQSRLREPFNLDLELNYQKKMLQLYRDTFSQYESEPTSDEEILSGVDQFIDQIFEFDLNAVGSGKPSVKGLNPIVTNDRQLDELVRKYVDKTYIEMVEQHEKPIEEVLFVQPEGWKTFEFEEIDEFRKFLLGEDSFFGAELIEF